MMNSKPMFFEFDTDDRSAVTSASCRFFAEHCIEQLMAVIKLQRNALQEAVDCGMVPISSAKEGGAARHSQQVIVADKIREALALQPADVELVEVGSFVMHEDKIGNRYPSSQMSYNYDDFEIADINKLYTIKTKADTK